MLARWLRLNFYNKRPSGIFDLPTIRIESSNQDYLAQRLSKIFQVTAANSSDQVDLVVLDQNQGISLEWFKQSDQENTCNRAKPLVLHIDIEGFVRQQKTYPAAKQGAFNQALGKKTRKIVDATAGWGSDALLMCAQGYEVRMIERNPLMAILLEEAMQRLSRTQWVEKHKVSVPQVVEADAKSWLKIQANQADCLYLDPMFPPKRKKSAATHKTLQFLHWLLQEEPGADDLLQAALNTNCPRVAVKRPDYAAPLLENSVRVNDRFSSKLVHYDVYIQNTTT